MKKLFLLFAITLITGIIHAQRPYQHRSQVIIQDVPPSTAKDSVLSIDENGLVVKVPVNIQLGEITPDPYLGKRYEFLDSNINGLYDGINRNERTGIDIYNTSTGTSATVGFVASRSSTPFINSVSMQYFGTNYFGVPLRDKGGLYGTNGVLFVAANASPFQFFSVPDTNLGGMNSNPVLDMESTSFTWRMPRTTIASITSGNSKSITTKEWVEDYVSNNSSVSIVETFLSISDLKNTTGKSIGDYVETIGYFSGSTNGGAIYIKVDPSGLTSNDMDIIEATDGSYYQLVNKTVNPYMFGSIEQDVNSTDELQSFFDYVGNTSGTIGDFQGEWWVNNTITISGSNKRFICGKIDGRNNGAIEPLISIETTQSNFVGFLQAYATTIAAYSAKNQITGIDWGNSGSRNKFEKIRIEGFKGYGAKIYGRGGGSTIMESIDAIKITGCGSTGSSYVTGSATANVSAVVNSGSANSVGQTSVITVDSVDSAWVEEELLEINGKVHIIKGISGNDITVYPWVDNTFTGTIYGLNGGLLIAGSNSASVYIGQIDAIRCGNALRTGGLYGAIVNVVQSQVCGSGLSLGYVENSNNLGSIINHYYVENNTFNMIQVTRVDTNTKINMVTETLSKIFIMDAQTSGFNASKNNYLKAVVNLNSNIYTHPSNNRSQNDINTSSTVGISNDPRSDNLNILKDSPTFILKWKEENNSIFAMDFLNVNVFGSGSNNEPTGTITFNLDSADQTAGITVMGGTSYTLSGLTKPANISILFDYDNQDWLISNASGLPDSASAWEIINSNGGILTINRNDTTVNDSDEIGGIEFKSEDGSFAPGDEMLARLIGVADGALGVGSNSKMDLVYYARSFELGAYNEQFRINSNGVVESQATDANIDLKGNTSLITKGYADNNYIQSNTTGWASYQDTEYTTGSPLTVTTGGSITLPNNAATIVDSQKPTDINTFYYSQKVNISGVSGTFVIGETITGGTSSATAIISEVQAGYLLVVNETDKFANTETITGGTSSATATVSGVPEDGAITGRNGDGLAITIEFKVRPTSAASDVRIQVTIDIGGAVGEIYPRDFALAKGNGFEHYYLSSFTGYTLDTWETNGGKIKVEPFNSNVEIYDIRYVLTRTHKAN